MCGRFALYSGPITIADHFEVEIQTDLFPCYNVAPTQNIPIVRNESGNRKFSLARWGLIPHWARDMKISFSTINARAETVANKPAFRNAFRQRRCLIPADGFYEWQVVPSSKTKQPWFITLQNREPMAFAGLWEIWRSPEGETVQSCSIIVTEANDLMRPIHERMPVILSPDEWDNWMMPDRMNSNELQDLLKPYPEAMTVWPVSTMVNNPRNDSKECMEQIFSQQKGR